MNAYDIMDALNRVEDEQLEAAREFYHIGQEEMKPMKQTRTLLRTLLIAAVITALMGVTAYAGGLFDLSSREVEQDETFHVLFQSPYENIEGDWHATYALEFEGEETCQAVHYRFGRLPKGYIGFDSEFDEDGWVARTDWEEGNTGLIPWGEHVECSSKIKGSYFISDMYYIPQFVDDGALILMSHVPDQVQEETRDGRQLIKIISEHWKDYHGELHEMPTVHYILLIDPEQGWVFALRGTASMEELEQIAEAVEIEQTEEIVQKDQFENPYDFFDAARG